MPRAWCWYAISLLCLGATHGGAATVLTKTVAVDVAPGGKVRESVTLHVLLETASDVEAWAAYPVYLDENRSLESITAAVVQGDGSRVKVGRKRQDRVEYSGAGIVDSSRYFHVVELPGLEKGATLEIAYRVAVEPYYPSDQMRLLGEDPIARLEVTVRGADGWRLDGPTAGLTVEELADGIKVRGRDLEAVEPADLAAGGAASEPVLRFAWGGDASWREVGRWYGDLIAGLPRDTEAVRRLAADLTAADPTPRQRLEALLAYMRRKVRYVAVEVGIGGYRPSPPAEVLSRKWGDCKDKSLLLIDLLDQAGIEARPALVLLAEDRRIEPEFPSPAQFNHLIVAVPVGAVPVGDGDPVAGGYLFLDPTQTRGTARWLHPGVQDQDALVVTPDGGELVRTPVMPRHESSLLVVDLAVSPAGDASGRAGLLIEGSLASGLLDQISSSPPERTREDVLAIFKALLPGARLADAGWQEREGEVPAVQMSLAVEVEGLVTGRERPAFRLAGLRAAPEPRLLDDLDTAAVHRARVARTLWRLELADGWCPPRDGETKVENALGAFVQTVGRDADGKVLVERRSEIRHRWIGRDRLADLEELALAEHRASRRRIRLVCEE